ncbi:MAG TPA: Rieske 2Fe-2S domain-containing protein [Anaeromyxobacter sp.]|nr:Rieske 2Fe-2S domain-containing protein [Anaeromyxobacter sp.]
MTLPHAWFITCRSRDLSDRPLGVVLQGAPVVLFRGADGRPAALEDRCPHRNAPLSAGRMRGGELECGYHGWRFDARGACVAVPGLAHQPARPARAPAFACVEQDGYVWTYATADADPRGAPFRFPHLGDAGYTAVRREFTVRASLRAALENVLDVPHTAFLHGGLFRTRAARADVEVVVRRRVDRCEAEFIGEPRPQGLAARLLAPRGGVVTHVDRFLLPSIAQVEYRIGDASHLVATTAVTPQGDGLLRLFSVVTFRLPVPGWLVAPVASPLASRILAQDARMLALQAENVARFGGERFANTELDVLGPQIARLLEAAERGGELAAADRLEHEHRVRMRL